MTDILEVIGQVLTSSELELLLWPQNLNCHVWKPMKRHPTWIVLYYFNWPPFWPPCLKTYKKTPNMDNIVLFQMTSRMEVIGQVRTSSELVLLLWPQNQNLHVWKPMKRHPTWIVLYYFNWPPFWLPFWRPMDRFRPPVKLNSYFDPKIWICMCENL